MSVGVLSVEVRVSHPLASDRPAIALTVLKCCTFRVPAYDGGCTRQTRRLTGELLENEEIDHNRSGGGGGVVMIVLDPKCYVHWMADSCVLTIPLSVHMDTERACQPNQ